MKRHGFTLIELLVVIAILGLLAAVLFPVFAHVRENGRQTACLSNERQLSIGLQLYAHDNDDTFPSGTHGGKAVSVSPPPVHQEPGGNGTGWAGEVFPYVKATATFACPDDAPVPSSVSDLRGCCDGIRVSPAGVRVSYGYNSLLVDMPAPGGQRVDGKIDSLYQPSDTVLLFEVSGDTVDVSQTDEGASRGVTLFSASGDGTGLTAATGKPDQQGNAPALVVRGVFYATGRLAGASSRPDGDPDGLGDVFPFQEGRHGGGSNILLSDGHVKWLLPEKICPIGVPAGRSESEFTAHF